MAKGFQRIIFRCVALFYKMKRESTVQHFLSFIENSNKQQHIFPQPRVCVQGPDRMEHVSCALSPVRAGCWVEHKGKWKKKRKEKKQEAVQVKNHPRHRWDRALKSAQHQRAGQKKDTTAVRVCLAFSFTEWTVSRVIRSCPCSSASTAFHDLCPSVSLIWCSWVTVTVCVVSLCIQYVWCIN